MQPSVPPRQRRSFERTEDTHVVTDEGDSVVEQVELPGYKQARSWLDDLDEDAGKNLVAVEEEVVCEPAGETESVSSAGCEWRSSAGQSTNPKAVATSCVQVQLPERCDGDEGRTYSVPVVASNKLERVHVVARGVLLLFRLLQRSVGVLDFEDAVPDEPSMEDSNDAKRDAVGELRRLYAVRRFGPAVEGDEENHEDDLVKDCEEG